MGTHYFTAGYFNPILFTSAIGHQIRFIHSRASFSERGRASRIQYLHLYWKNLKHVVFGSVSLTLIGEQENVKNSATLLKGDTFYHWSYSVVLALTAGCVEGRQVEGRGLYMLTQLSGDLTT